MNTAGNRKTETDHLVEFNKENLYKICPQCVAKLEIHTHTQCGQEHFLTTETCMTCYFMSKGAAVH